MKTVAAALVVGLGGVVAASGCTSGAPTIGGTLAAITATDTGLIAVGGDDDGEPLILTSQDAEDWERERITDDRGGLSDVAFGNGNTVAVGSGGAANAQIAVKPPAGPWQVELIGTDNYRVFFGNGAFLSDAGGEPGTKVSSDGITWTDTPPGEPTAGFDGRFFVSLGGAPIAFRTSSDGLTWSDPVSPSASFVGTLGIIAPVGDQILGFGSACAGTTCYEDTMQVQFLGAQGTTPASLAISAAPWTDIVVAIASGRTRAVAASSYVLHTTALPVGSAPWTEVEVASRGWSISDVAYAAGRFVAVGWNVNSHALVVTSADGVDWREATLPPSE